VTIQQWVHLDSVHVLSPRIARPDRRFDLVLLVDVDDRCSIGMADAEHGVTLKKLPGRPKDERAPELGALTRFNGTSCRPGRHSPPKPCGRDSVMMTERKTASNLPVSPVPLAEHLSKTTSGI
jgi:hypothetical protein